ncbi:UDP-N-acetylmuramoyl-tripeptide--D-alanyl-D-alanine ligase [Gammaproteobacteria bacterium]|nr:UDP-N-acetylmuramoyl-tripeptide--D-alanyl-D-alanine ligase [Gammaproteobacteria bacterium]MDA9259096.1 UDP-N-acetylmuramoyl-tripeptide--D-alanyl-D-alanine ligase [Gammaproteobacteria bacterium]MDA9268965.1 UDP-N-acetylmuramoyl-tripeptide--D-alanyl-D-alanine ligase [Gammaproteobacteria bacterium]MDB9901061.1 UDP-N-acetylmuramoyl-tripeptide--D-alanyl-D-alanine ligase [Gammaproteobacteria bacterium]MDC0123494.1 UDP-N-acetylmuramoyl-tripeptide--D-alanyl-D-alanine ligase [Gammaproteobacteria bact
MKFIQNTSDILSALGIAGKHRSLIKDFCIDSREAKQHSVFIGLTGSNEDGSKYCDDAFSNGAVFAIIKAKKDINANKLKDNTLGVSNPEKALAKLAQVTLKNFTGPVIGITGSNGKTTTKNILSAGIKNSFSTFKNFNNEIGLPLCALMLDLKNEAAIFEMGAAKKGDIHFLSKIIQPDIGIITHIGHSHLLGLNSLKGVLEVKSELIHNIKNNGTAIVPNGPHLNYWRRLRKDISFITFGLDDSAEFFASNIESSPAGTSFSIYSQHFKDQILVSTPLMGNHNILNILAAFSSVYQLNGDMNFFLKSLKSFKNESQRLEFQPWINQSNLINDSYNANPDSVKAAIDVLHQMRGRKIMILGDMKELGRYRKKFHKEIGEYAKIKNIDLFLGFGDLAKHSVNSFGSSGIFFNSKIALTEFLKSEISKKDYVLLKGSRGMRMEEFINIGDRDD